MMRLACLLIPFASQVFGESLVAARTIPARSIVMPEDVMVRDVETIGGISDPSEAVGKEARVALYAGRPIRAADLVAPAVVERNQIVMLVYQRGSISISTEGRALDRAGPGDRIRVMNLSSRTTVNAQIDASGTAYVAQ